MPGGAHKAGHGHPYGARDVMAEPVGTDHRTSATSPSTAVTVPVSVMVSPG